MPQNGPGGQGGPAQGPPGPQGIYLLGGIVRLLKFYCLLN